MNWFGEWLPWFAVTIIPGGLNTFIAYGELAERCKIFPFFQPYKIPGVWLWGVIQVFFPAGLFWLVASLAARPQISSSLIIEAIAFGIGFTALLNASITIRAHTYSVKPIYDRFIQIAYIAIRNSRQGDRALEFWGEVEVALHQSPDLTEGLRYLEDYFAVEASFALRPDDYEARLTEVRAETDRSKQAKLIKSLLQKVRRERLCSMLWRFQIGDGLLLKYFPNRVSKTRIRRRP
ncbi:hypothetical protein IQ268_24230 [Oculatella sp. LEGE 06141]|uniref:hypothetical protein n=1 Tax=Oculatella sp. LEGE 06141 TaxID=1828648 RepID=UPI001880DC73|nr:hypothetical protein [Oculatella sp. LEGE 06141]MBE9181677.1 hypothetical protein [Oculatella sp. LEGE 06141]